MPGRAATRARRAEVVARADEVGAVKAGAEFGVLASTVRSWRRRLREEAREAEASAPPAAAPEREAEPVSVDAIDHLRTRDRKSVV